MENIPRQLTGMDVILEERKFLTVGITSGIEKRGMCGYYGSDREMCKRYVRRIFMK